VTTTRVKQTAKQISELLDGRLLSSVESCTGGRVTQAFAMVEGSVDWFLGGMVAYRLEIKRQHLGVTAPSMYTEQCAAEMARGIATMFGADVAVSTTGVIGCEPQDGVDPGTVFIGTYVSGDLATKCHHFDATGDEACELAAEQALADLLARLQLVGTPSIR
jgi:nicotinamide-nucleotide amidase